MRHATATVLLVAGCTLQVLAVVGLVSMRNTLDRLHYVGLAGYGALLVGVAVLVRQSFSLIGDKALLAGVLLAVLGPVMVHVTARSLRIRAHDGWRAGIEEARER
ncbi:MAG TPA: monovalent cation/H(+) antiporter subunit G [Solirubrobacteraceae bacterium]